MIDIFKKHTIYRKEDKIIATVDIITGLSYQEFEDEGYWKDNGFKADYSLEVGDTRVAVYKVNDMYRYLTNDKIKDPLVLYKDLKNWGGMKGMIFSELDEWEMIK